MRSLLIHSGLDSCYWGEALLTANYLINLLPTPILNWSSPYQILHNSLPDISHLRVFGCLCYVYSPPASKLDVRSKKGVFLGYADGSKGYKVLILDSNRIEVSRNVILYESVFPCKSTTPSLTCPNSPSPNLSFPSFGSVPSFDQPPSTDHNISSPPSPLTCSYDPSSSFSSPVHQSDSSSSSSPTLPPTRPTRAIVPPVWMKDYIGSLSLSHSQKDSSLPSSYKEASSDPHWIDAINNELEALEKNKTWSVVPHLPGINPIGCKWIFRIKRNPDGSIIKYKANWQ